MIQRPDGSQAIKRRIAGTVLVTHTLDTALAVTATQTQYLLTDQLGSVVEILDSSGNSVQALSFDPWGQRRNTTDWTALLGNYLPGFDISNTTRGFTGHETVDAVGLIHMNGRIYEPKLARFMQADSFVQAPMYSQSYNRYAYVFNNPLGYTDPSGYFGLSEVVSAVVAAVVGLPAQLAISAYYGYELYIKDDSQRLAEIAQPGVSQSAFGGQAGPALAGPSSGVGVAN